MGRNFGICSEMKTYFFFVNGNRPIHNIMTSSYGKGFLAGTAIGIPGGLIGLGGAEFRLPLLIGMFMFSPLDAVILNKAMSLIVVGSALPFRTGTVPWSAVAANWPVIVNLLAGSLAGAWAGAGWAVNLRKERSTGL